MGSAEMSLISLCPLSCLPAVSPYFKTSKRCACLRGVVFIWGYLENIQTHTLQSVTGKNTACKHRQAITCPRVSPASHSASLTWKRPSFPDTLQTDGPSCRQCRCRPTLPIFMGGWLPCLGFPPGAIITPFTSSSTVAFLVRSESAP